MTPKEPFHSPAHHSDLIMRLRNARPLPPDDLLERCQATVPSLPTTKAIAQPRFVRALALAGSTVAAVAAVALLPTRNAQPPTGMPAVFAQTERAMQQVTAWHVKERFVPLEWLRAKPRPLHLTHYYPQCTETWYRADAGELFYHNSVPDEPITKRLLKPNGDQWARWVNRMPRYRNPSLKKMHEEMDARLRKATKGRFGNQRALPPARYLKIAVNARGEFYQWDSLEHQNMGDNLWNARREYMQAKIMHPEEWGQHAAAQVLVQNLTDNQRSKLKVKNHLLRNEKRLWKGHIANYFEFQVIPTGPAEAMPRNLPDIFLVTYVDPVTHRIIATQESFQDRGQTKRLMFRQQEFDYTEAAPERFSVEEFSRGAVPLVEAPRK